MNLTPKLFELEGSRVCGQPVDGGGRFRPSDEPDVAFHRRQQVRRAREEQRRVLQSHQSFSGARRRDALRLRHQRFRPGVSPLQDAHVGAGGLGVAGSGALPLRVGTVQRRHLRRRRLLLGHRDGLPGQRRRHLPQPWRRAPRPEDRQVRLQVVTRASFPARHRLREPRLLLLERDRHRVHGSGKGGLFSGGQGVQERQRRLAESPGQTLDVVSQGSSELLAPRRFSLLL
ncbi:uncharacterized protein LOC144067479 [Stigmatopora argus]